MFCCNILNTWTSAMRKHPLPLCPSLSYFTRPPSPLVLGRPLWMAPKRITHWDYYWFINKLHLILFGRRSSEHRTSAQLLRQSTRYVCVPDWGLKQTNRKTEHEGGSHFSQLAKFFQATGPFIIYASGWGWRETFI